MQHGDAAHPQARVAQPVIHGALNIGLPGPPAQQDVAHHTGQPIDRIAKDTDRDRYLTATESKEYGLVDDVLTKPPVAADDEGKD